MAKYRAASLIGVFVWSLAGRELSGPGDTATYFLTSSVKDLSSSSTVTYASPAPSPHYDTGTRFSCRARDIQTEPSWPLPTSAHPKISFYERMFKETDWYVPRPHQRFELHPEHGKHDLSGSATDHLQRRARLGALSHRGVCSGGRPRVGASRPQVGQSGEGEKENPYLSQVVPQGKGRVRRSTDSDIGGQRPAIGRG